MSFRKDDVAGEMADGAPRVEEKDERAPASSAGAVPFVGITSGSGEQLPRFKDQVGMGKEVAGRIESPDGQQPPGAIRVEGGATAGSNGVLRLPTFKDQVNEAPPSDERRHATPFVFQDPQQHHDALEQGMSSPQIYGPEFKDQVRRSRNDRVGGDQRWMKTCQDLQNDTFGTNLDAAEEGREDSSTTNENAPNLIEAELVGHIQAAQVVSERRRMKRNLCIVLVVINVLLVAALVLGGTCLFGDCFLVEEDSDQLQNLNVSCIVDLDIKCETLGGTMCSEIEPRNTSLCPPNVTGIQFQLINAVCDSTENVHSEIECVDVAPLVVSRPTKIQCSANDDGSALLVEPNVVMNDDLFVVTTMDDNSGMELPDRLTCWLIGQPNGDVFQRVEIDTTSNTTEPGTQFGALLVRGCSNTACQDTLRYTVTVNNPNRNAMYLSSFEFTAPNGVPEELLGTSDHFQVEAGASMNVTRDVEVETCFNFEYLAWAFLESDLDNGAVCEGGKEYAPTLPPSPAPTPVPTNASNIEVEDCTIVVSVDCKNEEGHNCSEVEDPTASCGADFSALRFRYDPSYSCDPIEHSQGGSASCQDLVSLSDESIIVLCETPDGDAIRVEPAYVRSFDGDFVISPLGGQFPEKIHCSLITEQGLVMQTNSIDTSGTVEVRKGDRFGAMLLTACSGDPSCSQFLTYNVTIRNTGETPFFLERFELELNDENFDLSFGDDADEEFVSPLLVGQSISVQQRFEVNTCSDETADVKVFANGKPPSGTRYCSSQVSFDPAMPGPPNCAVDSFVTCYLGDGRPCSASAPREGSCLGREFVALKFRYRDVGCGGQGLSSHCTDFAPMPEEVDIQCVNENGARLVVEPSRVEKYEEFTISTELRGNLNGTVDCVFRSLGGRILQRSEINVAQFQDVKEGSRSGAMEIISCSDPSCREKATYNVTVRNEGSQQVSITQWDIDEADRSIRDYLPDSFLPYIEKNPLGVGEMTSVILELEKDVCFGNSRFHMTAEVSGQTSTAETCDNDDDSSSSASSSGSSDLPPPLLATPSPTSSPPLKDEPISREAIFGLVVTFVAVNLILGIGLYAFYQRWNAQRKVGAATAEKSQKTPGVEKR